MTTLTYGSSACTPQRPPQRSESARYRAELFDRPLLPRLPHAEDRATEERRRHDGIAHRAPDVAST
jgi:hypothetical protein